MVEISYLEFDDQEDRNSDAYPENQKKGSFRLRVEPQMYLLAMVTVPDALEVEILEAVRTLLRMAYEQGKAVGSRLELERREQRLGCG